MSTGSHSFLGKVVKAVFYICRAYFVGVGVVATFLFFLLLFNLDRLDFRSQPRKSLAEDQKVVLVIELNGRLLDRMPSFRREFLRSFTGDVGNVYLSDLRRVFELALDDSRVEAVFLDIQSLSGSLVDFGQLRSAVADFANSDKTVVSFLTHGDNNNYFLATAGGRIVVSPATMLEIPGPVLNLVYFGDALTKLGVGVQVLQTGEFKSAFEPLIRNTPSQETQEMYAQLEDDLRSYLVNGIAAGRKRPASEVEAWLERSIFTATDAVEAGLVDSVWHSKDALAQLKFDLDITEHISYRDYLKGMEEPAADSSVGIGYVEAIGDIYMDGNEWEHILPRRLTKELEWMRNNDAVKAVVVRVVSAGGSALASELIWREVSRLNAEKPTIVSMGAQAASGGYYLAVGASYLFAEPTTITGSIGVTGMIPNFADFKDKYGVSFYTITQSRRRDYYDYGRPLSTLDQQIIEESLQEIYQVFLQRVAAGRGIAFADLEPLAGGLVYTGRQALELGLVDALGGLPAAFKKAKELGKLDPQKKYLVHTYRGDKLSLVECIRSTMDIRRCLSEVSFGLESGIERVQRSLTFLTADKLRVLTMWLGSLSLRNF